MKALIGRDTDGWGTRGFVALLDDGRTISAADAPELVSQLRAVGVDAITMSGEGDGDRGLSAKLQQSFLDAWQLRGQ